MYGGKVAYEQGNEVVRLCSSVQFSLTNVSKYMIQICTI